MEAIRTDALLANCPDIAETTEALATFFRYTISNVQEYVTFSDELDNAENYFTIQRCRSVTKSLELELENERLLKCGCRSSSCSRWWRTQYHMGWRANWATARSASLWKTATGHFPAGAGRRRRDAGRTGGAAQRAVRRSWGRGYDPAVRRIALRNVNSRIRLMFGEDYGLHLFSAAGVGTECCVTLPLRFREA
ncbi:MAG: sensor histidine kinase [Dysosmobacter welbionis]